MILVQAHLRENNPNAAIDLLRNVLALDAVTYNAAQVYVEKNGTDPPKLAETERVLRDATQHGIRDTRPT